MYRLLIIFLILTSLKGYSQTGATDDVLEHLNDDLSIGTNIFSSFEEDVESSQILEDERFYRFGRFYSINFGVGHTSFLGNRGNAYNDKLPGFLLSFNYFFNFRSSFVMGAEMSTHVMDINFPTVKGSLDNVGRVNVSFIRPFIGYRYYFDTQNLNAIFTHSNPYFTARFEYWYQTNKFDDSRFDKETGGGVGAGIGFGVEFPLVLKQRYLGVELLFHPVDLFDADTEDYQSSDQASGYKNLQGMGFGIFISVNETW